jgi:hypothetical protein
MTTHHKDGYPGAEQGEMRMSCLYGIRAARYQIEVQGRLDEQWSLWFNDVTVTVNQAYDGSPVTTLTIGAVDQAKLRGILNKLWDMNLTVISVVLLAE